MKKLWILLLLGPTCRLYAFAPKPIRQEITYEDTQKQKEAELRLDALMKKRKSGERLTIPEQVELSRLRTVGIVH